MPKNISVDIFLENKEEVLFIKGVNMNKVNTDVHGVDDCGSCDSNNIFDIGQLLKDDYDKIVKKYINYESWACTNLCCWYCTLKFANKPIFIPLSIQKDLLEAHGNFCTFGCAAKYINIYFKHDDKRRCEYINHLKYLYKDIYKSDVAFFVESPDKEMLNKYGGCYSSDEYKKKIKL